MGVNFASELLYSPECEPMLEHIAKHNIRELFHFTGVQNLPIIAEVGGLLSKEGLETRGIWPCPDPGGNELSHDLDRTRGNWSKVSLSYTPYAPMAYRRKPVKHLCFIVLKPEVLCLNKVLFTNMNATANGHVRAKGLEGLQQVYFDEITCSPRGWDRDWLDKAQAEVLVPDFIPISFISHLGFISQVSLTYGRLLWNAKNCPECLVKPNYFAHNPKHTAPAIPYLEGIVLSSKSIEKVQEDIDARKPTPHESTFSGFWDGTITVKALVQGAPGSKVYAKLRGNGVEETTEEVAFMRRMKSMVLFSFDIDRLSIGTYHVDFYIEAATPILWTQVHFEVTE